MSLFRTKKEIQRLEDDLVTVSNRVYALESAHKRLGLEWEELYDKVRHQMSRMSKRVAVDHGANGDLPPEMDDRTGLPSVDPISARILARRGQVQPK